MALLELASLKGDMFICDTCLIPFGTPASIYASRKVINGVEVDGIDWVLQ
jgi:hypothetical protein